MRAGKSILIVEDEADLAELLSFNLQREGFACRRASDGAAALEEVRKRPPDLIILDRMLPHVSGDEVITQLKRDTRSQEIPIIMLTAKVEDSDELVGFTLGADDYVRKPFSMKLLLARVEAILRRTEPGGQEREVLTAGPIVLDRSRHEVRVDGVPRTLTTTEFGLLGALMAADERVLTRDQLIDAVLGPGVAVTDRTIDVHIAALRKKIGIAAKWIQTVRGVGYTLRAPR
jgi:two-component system phosphate regulon response regulator PhoB